MSIDPPPTLPFPVLLARCRALLGQALDRRTQDWPVPCTLALPPVCTREVLAQLLYEIDAALTGSPRDCELDRATALAAIRELPDYERDQLLADCMARPR